VSYFYYFYKTIQLVADQDSDSGSLYAVLGLVIQIYIPKTKTHSIHMYVPKAHVIQMYVPKAHVEIVHELLLGVHTSPPEVVQFEVVGENRRKTFLVILTECRQNRLILDAERSTLVHLYALPPPTQ